MTAAFPMTARERRPRRGVVRRRAGGAFPHVPLAPSLLLGLAACGGADDSGSGGRDAAVRDAAVADVRSDVAAQDLGADREIVDGPAPDASPDMTPPPPLARAAVLTTGGGMGSITLVDLDTLVPTADAQPAPNDATARFTNGKLYVLDRNMESLTIRNVDDDLTLDKTFSIGAGSTLPQDVCCSSANRCFVPRSADAGVLIVDPEAALQVLGEIDLSSLDSDGNPNAFTCQTYGNDLFIGLKRLVDPGQIAQSPGRIAIVSLGSETLAGSFDTPTLGPITRFQLDDGGPASWLGEAGLTGIADGALVDVDLAGRTASVSRVAEADLGANLLRFAVCRSGEAWIITISLTPPGFPVTSLRKADLATGVVDPPLHTTPGSELSWIAADSADRIWVADQSDSPTPGLRVWNCDGTPLSPDPNPIPVGAYAPNREGTITFIP